MNPSPLPLVVLAGADREPPVLPESGARLHPLSGYKAVDLKVGGRALIDLLLDRLRESGCFEPIFVAGPRRIYGPARNGAAVIDTDGTLGENLDAGLSAAQGSCPGAAIAVTTCDILPEVEELQRLMSDYYRHQPLDFWFPVILAPRRSKRLGASFWKPKYRMRRRRGEEPRSLLPGHLVIADPQALRLPLIYRSFNLAYATRNRPILYRLVLIVSQVFAGLVWQDLRHILGLRLPTLTYTVVANGIGLAFELRSGLATTEELADRLRRIFVKYRHRREHPEREGRLPLMPGLSLAKDVDTQEEAEELAGGLQ